MLRMLNYLIEFDIGHDHSHVLTELLVRDTERRVNIIFFVASFAEYLGRCRKVPLTVPVQLSNFLSHVLNAKVR